MVVNADSHQRRVLLNITFQVPASPLVLHLIKRLLSLNPSKGSSELKLRLFENDTFTIFLCSKCPVSFHDESLHQAHVASHEKSNYSSCRHCSLLFSNQEAEDHEKKCLHIGEAERIEHLIAVEKVQSKSKTYSCTHNRSGCPRVFEIKEEMHNHARFCSKRPKNHFECSIDGCKKKYYYEADYLKHKRKDHSVSQ